MNALHYLIKYNCFKKKLSFDDITTDCFDVGDEELKILPLDVNPSALTEDKNNSTETNDLLKIRVCIFIYF